MPQAPLPTGASARKTIQDEKVWPQIATEDALVRVVSTRLEAGQIILMPLERLLLAPPDLPRAQLGQHLLAVRPPGRRRLWGQVEPG